MSDDNDTKNVDKPVEHVGTVTLFIRMLFYNAPLLALICGFTGIVNKDATFVFALSMLCVHVLIDSTMKGIHNLALLIVRFLARKTDT